MSKAKYSLQYLIDKTNFCGKFNFFNSVREVSVNIKQ